MITTYTLRRQYDRTKPDQVKITSKFLIRDINSHDLSIVYYRVYDSSFQYDWTDKQSFKKRIIEDLHCSFETIYDLRWYCF